MPTERDRANMDSTIVGNIVDNSTGLVEPSDVRDDLRDLTASALFPEDDVLVIIANWDASVNVFPDSPAYTILKGHIFPITGAGTLGAISVEPGDLILALIDTPGQTLANWGVLLAQSVNAGLKTVEASGTDSYAITEALPIAYDTKERFLVRFTNANTGASTLNRASLGDVDIKKAGGVPLVSGDIVANGTYLLSYNGTYYQLVGDGSSSGGGGGTVMNVSTSGGILSVSSPTTTPNISPSGTSGGVVYFNSASTWASSALLAANALMVGGGAGATPATITTGTGILTALGINTGSAGAPVLFNGVLGTPSSGTATNLTGLPATTGLTGIVPIANGGTNKSSFTSGSQIFFDGTRLQESNAENFWDNSNKRLYLGYNAALATTSSGSGRLQVAGTNIAGSNLSIYRASADASGPTLNLTKDRNAAIGGNTLINDNDAVGAIGFRVANGATFLSRTAEIVSRVDDPSPSATSTGGELDLLTTAVGSTTTTSRLLLGSDGSWTVNGSKGTANTSVLISGGSASPSWGDPNSIRNPDISFYKMNEMFFLPNDDWANIGATGSSGSSTVGVNTTENVIGAIFTRPGTGTTDYAGIYSPASIAAGTHAITTQARIELSDLSDGTNTYTAYFGLGDENTSGTQHANGAYFRYTHSVNGGEWEAVTAAGGSRTATDTNVATVAGSYVIFKISINQARTSVTFYIDGTLVATNSTNIPASANLIAMTHKLVKSAGATQPTIYVDWTDMLFTRTSAR